MARTTAGFCHYVLPSVVIFLAVPSPWPLHRAACAKEAADNKPAVPASSPQPNVQAVIDLATSLERQHRYEEAIEQYEKAIAMPPQNLAARNNLAWLLATCPVDHLRDGKKAIAQATKVVSLPSGSIRRRSIR